VEQQDSGQFDQRERRRLRPGRVPGLARRLRHRGGRFVDYDNFSRETETDSSFQGLLVGGQARFGLGQDTALFAGIGYSSLGSSLGEGVGVSVGMDLPLAGPVAAHCDLTYREFSTKVTTGGSSADVSGSVILLRGGIGLVF
jgi:hypothetical protein